MKARTPSFMARFRFPLTVATGLLITAGRATADDGVPISPEVAPAAPVASAANDEEPQVASQTARTPATTHGTYQNPFAAEAKGPPIENAPQSSSAGQWRRPTIPRWVAPPSESVVENKSPVAEKSPTPPAVQQVHNTTPVNVAPLAKPTLPTTQSTPRPKSSHTTATLVQPDSVSNGPAFPAAKSAASSKVTTVGATEKRSTPPTKKDVDHASTPESCLAQAQAAASHAASTGDLGRVIESCDRGLQAKPAAKTLQSLQRLAAWAHNRRGEIFADSQQLDEALRDFQTAIELDPKCSLAFHNRGVTFAQRNQFAAALRDFNRVIELNPGLAVAYRNRAELLSALDRTQDALADYDRAIKSLPNDAALHLARASAKQRLGNFAGAAADIERALTLAPNDPAALVQRGNLAADQARFADAEKDFRQAIRLNAKLAEAHRSLAWLQATCPDAKLRKPDQALVLARRAVELSPNDYQALDTLAAAEASAGDFSRAVASQQKALTLAPLNLNNPLQDRLALYQQHRVYRTPGPHNVRTASMEAPTTPVVTQPAMPSAQRSGIVR